MTLAPEEEAEVIQAVKSNRVGIGTMDTATIDTKTDIQTRDRNRATTPLWARNRVSHPVFRVHGIRLQPSGGTTKSHHAFKVNGRGRRDLEARNKRTRLQIITDNGAPEENLRMATTQTLAVISVIQTPAKAYGVKCPNDNFRRKRHILP